MSGVIVTGPSGEDDFNFRLARNRHFEDHVMLTVLNNSERIMIYTFDDFFFGGVPSAGTVQSCGELEPWGSRVHCFSVRLTNTDQPRVRRIVGERRVPMRFGLATIFEPDWEAVDQVDPHEDAEEWNGIRGHADLVINPDFQRHYRGVVRVPGDITANYVLIYDVE